MILALSLGLTTLFSQIIYDYCHNDRDIIENNVVETEKSDVISVSVDTSEAIVLEVENEKIESESNYNVKDNDYTCDSDYYDYEITAYDLSEEDCGKSEDNPYYGLTANGFNLSGLSREDAMVIAVDRNIIPLGSKVEIIFEDEEFSYLNGIYNAEDTGGAIRGNRIDIYFGVDKYYECIHFGRRMAKVRIVE